jgi:hypothetical protein
MAHFAEIDNENIVQRVIVVDNEVCLAADGTESEEIGSDYCSSLLGGTWVQTSYNGRIRGKYAAIGDYFDMDLDQFVDLSEGPMSTPLVADYATPSEYN